jgi:hypothetical protein
MVQETWGPLQEQPLLDILDIPDNTQPTRAAPGLVSIWAIHQATTLAQPVAFHTPLMLGHMMQVAWKLAKI